jgi:hypothetical protein
MDQIILLYSFWSGKLPKLPLGSFPVAQCCCLTITYRGSEYQKFSTQDSKEEGKKKNLVGSCPKKV